MCNKSADGMYSYTENMIQLYNRLQDKQSKEIFWARIQFDVEPNLDRAFAIGSLNKSGMIPECSNWRSELQQAADMGKRLVIYGAGVVGNTFAELLQNSGMDFYAFCDKKRCGETIYGKPVLSPEELIHHAESYAVVICTQNYYEEILALLQQNAFPIESILNCGKAFMTSGSVNQYRDFPNLFRKNTAIVDAGCFDGTDTIQFSRWCNGQYSKIYAFEPDENNYARCQKAIQLAGLTDVVLLQAGLDDTTGQSSFIAASTESSYLDKSAHIHQAARPSGQGTIVSTYALDDVIDTEVGMIKMDIEGAEFSALHGAEKVIRRDKPLLAICVYHRQGDMLAIMEYLCELVPEYRFWLRHYGALDSETVLYAAI